jgi:hypothetical protein
VLETVVRVFEILVQGALALGVIVYLLGFQHRWKRLLVMYYRQLVGFVLGRGVRDHVVVRGGILLGAVYYLGIVMNLFGFAILRPTHERIVSDVYTMTDMSAARRGGETSIATLCLLPVRGLWEAQARDTGYVRYLREEVWWRNRNREVAESTLDPILKQTRVARGTAACAFLFAMIAVMKIAFYLGTAALGGKHGRALRWVDRRFVRTDEPLLHHKGLVLGPRDREIVIGDLKRLVLVNWLYLMLAMMVYVMSVVAYRAGEREYHLMAHFGAMTARGVESR